MTSRQQFEALWKAGCKHAILAIIRNKGEPLSKKQLQHEVEHSIKSGLVNHVLVLTQVAQNKLTSHQVDRLVNRCLELEWVPDALRGAHQKVLSEKTRQKLLRAIVAEGLANSPEEASALLSCE